MLLTVQSSLMVENKHIVIALNDNEAKSLKTHKGIRMSPVICNLIVSSLESYQSLLKNIKYHIAKQDSSISRGFWRVWNEQE